LRLIEAAHRGLKNKDLVCAKRTFFVFAASVAKATLAALLKKFLPCYVLH